MYHSHVAACSLVIHQFGTFSTIFAQFFFPAIKIVYQHRPYSVYNRTDPIL